jgi:hypothetical protein
VNGFPQTVTVPKGYVKANSGRIGYGYKYLDIVALARGETTFLDVYDEDINNVMVTTYRFMIRPA